MVHNGIEYGDMQLICEAYSLMKALGLAAAEMSEVFAEWNEGELDSYLIEITRDILAKNDDETGQEQGSGSLHGHCPQRNEPQECALVCRLRGMNSRTFG